MLLIAVGNGGVIWAERSVPSGFVALLIAGTPFWMIGTEAAFGGGERPTVRILTGLLIGFSGVALLVWPDLTRGGAAGRQFMAGVIAVQIACLGWALGSSYSKRQGRDENPLAGAAIQMLCGGLAMLALGTALGEWSRLSFNWRSGLAEAYLLVVGSIVAYPAYVYALKHLPVSTVSLYAYINPIIAVMLGTLLLDEPFGPRVIVAAALVFLGIAVVRWKPVKDSSETRHFASRALDWLAVTAGALRAPRVRPPAGR
jgi:drug/metabolite transporter (DMT)-like permease